MADTTARTDSSQAQAVRIGAEMQAARQKLGWELPQLAASLRIRQTYLEAIETGRVADLPGSTYALGFVRAYAAALGLNAEDMARRFRADAMETNGQPALRFPAPVPQRGVPAGALMLLGLVILGGAYGGWYWVTEHRATRVETVPPIPERLAPAGQSAPSPQVATILPGTAPPSPAATPAPAPMPAPKPPAAEPSAPVTAAPATPAPNPATAAPPSAAASPQTPPAAATPAPQTAPVAPPPGGSRIVVKTTADAWVTIKQKGGPAVLNKMMHAGDTFDVPADKPDLTLTTGNAGGTTLEVDGAPIPTNLGGSGMVRRDLPMDPDMLKSGTLPPLRKPKPTPPTTDG